MSTPSVFAVVLRPADPAAAGDRDLTPEEGALLARQAQHLAVRTDEGQVLFAGRALAADDPLGIVLLNAEDHAGAEDAAAAMPAVAGGFLLPVVRAFELMATGDGRVGTSYAYLLRPTRADILDTGPTPAEERLMTAHWDYTRERHAAGEIALAGRVLPPGEAFAVMVTTVTDESRARSLVAAEPGVTGGLFTASLRVFETTVAPAVTHTLT